MVEPLRQIPRGPSGEVVRSRAGALPVYRRAGDSSADTVLVRDLMVTGACSAKSSVLQALGGWLQEKSSAHRCKHFCGQSSAQSSLLRLFSCS